MKATVVMKLFMISILTSLISPSFSQDEYDDMYFNASDRKARNKNDEVVARNTESVSPEQAKNTEDYGNPDENYSSKNINPEYIARYRNPKDSETGEKTMEGDSYYDEDYNRIDSMSADRTNVTNNYNNYYSYPSTFYNRMDPWFRYSMYSSMIYDPFYGVNTSPGWNFGMGYTFGYNPGWSFSISYGNTWGYSPYGMGGYYSPWGWDPWYDSYYPGSYYGYNPWGNSCFCGYSNYYGYNNGFYNGWYYGDNQKYPNNVTYGRRASRGATHLPSNTQIADSGRERRTVNNTTQVQVTDNNSVTDSRTRVSAAKDYSASQNEYYSRTRSSNNNSSQGTSYSRNNYSRSSGTANGNVNESRARTTGSGTDYSRPSYKTSRESTSSSGTYNYNRSSSSRTSGSYSSGNSYNNSRSYSSGSSSGSSSYSSGSSGGSRSSSSGSSGSSGSSSRSSGGGSSSSRSGRGN